MTQPDLKRLEQLFQAAADLPVGERAGFLERECGDEHGLRERVEAMLADLQKEGSLQVPAIGPGADLSEGPGSTIGRYKLLQVIGEGGFGVVYMAEQTEPVVRRVALKVIKLGMDTREVVARFEAERQALAMMDHPGIARVLDGGATRTGRPYFVMELVRGVSITEYCDANNLSTRARLELFGEVCQAVEHAHQKGVIHRDLKPTNVMVTLHDGRPAPKVIDFGIAKAMHTRLTEKTLFTAYERFIGTPAYMSPEQAEMSALDVDTRSDVYSLGVLLYELLTGTTPFDTAELLDEGLAEVKRVIREELPQRPSVRISTTADASIAQRRRSEPTALSRCMRGDLDWIVMKSLEKERGRRYATVSELAADIRRHLAHEPVLAGPPSSVYRMRKFLTRNRTAAASVSVITLLLFGGTIGTSIGMWEASQQRDEAVAAQQHAQSVTDFLVDTLSLTDPDVALNPDVSVRTLLDRASENADTAFVGDLRGEMRVRATIGKAYKSLGENERAEANLRRALDLLSGLDSVDPLEHYHVLWTLTHVLFRLERMDALAIAQRAREVAHAAIGERYPELGAALDSFVDAVNQTAFGGEQDRLDEVPALFAETVSQLAANGPPPGDPLRLIAVDTWMASGFSYWYSPWEALSADFWVKALEIQRQELPPNHPQIGETVSQLVGVLGRAGRTAEAERYIRDVVDRMREIYRPGNFNLAYLESVLGDNLARQGRFEEARDLLLPSHAAILATIQDESNFYVTDSYSRIIGLYESWGREGEAEPYRDRLAHHAAVGEMFPSFTLASMGFGAEHRAILDELRAMFEVCGDVYTPVSKRITPDSDLLSIVTRIVELRRAQLPEDDPRAAIVARAFLNWSKALDLAEVDLRRALMDEALAVLEHWRDDIPDDLAGCHAQLSELAYESGDWRGAADHAHRSWALLRGAGAPDNWLTASAKVRIAQCLVQQGLFDEAESILLPCYDVLVAQVGASNADTGVARALITDLYTAWGKPERAADFQEER